MLNKPFKIPKMSVTMEQKVMDFR